MLHLELLYRMLDNCKAAILFLTCNYCDVIFSLTSGKCFTCTPHYHRSNCTIEDFDAEFIKHGELQAANSPAKIAKLNVLETDIHLATADVDVGFAATATPTKP